MKLNLGLELKKKLASGAPRLTLPWLAKTGVTPVGVGSDANAPRGFGPAPRAPGDMPRMVDAGNGQVRPAPIPGVTEADAMTGIVDQKHNPESALDAIRAMVRRAHPNT